MCASYRFRAYFCGYRWQRPCRRRNNHRNQQDMQCLPQAESRGSILGSDWKLQNTITSNTAVELIEREVQIPTYGGAIAHGPQLSPGQTETFTFAITDISPSANGSVSGAVNYVYCGFRDKESEAWYPEITLSHPWQKGGHNPLICPPLSDSRLYRMTEIDVGDNGTARTSASP